MVPLDLSQVMLYVPFASLWQRPCRKVLFRIRQEEETIRIEEEFKIEVGGWMVRVTNL